jgi:Rhodanese-related sulfurtransferase
MKKIIITLLLVMLVGCSSKASINKINYTNAVKLLETNAIIIDVRTNEEYKNGHIENSINIPLGEIENIDFGKNENIILYCESGNRSNQASEILLELGYKKIYDLGSKNNWNEELVK